MTMIITMIRPEGIWQSTDYRITRGRIEEPDAPKQLLLGCPPLDDGPRALLGFTGLAEFPDRTPTLQWIRETLRGESRTIMETFLHLRDRLTRDVGASSRWRNELTITGGIFEGQRRFYVKISNIDTGTRQPKRQFEYGIHEVTQPTIFIAGSGQYYVKQEDRDLLIAQTNIRPASWEDHLGLLAGVNRRTAEDARGSVSPWCQASYLGMDREGALTKKFTRPGESAPLFNTETVFMGIDLHGLSRAAMELARRAEAGDTAPLPESDEFHGSIEGRP